MEKKVFDKIEAAFMNWLGQPCTMMQNQHPCDNERFYDFVQLLHEEGRSISEEEFTKCAVTHDTRYVVADKIEKRRMTGMYKKYWIRLNAILEYLKYIDRKNPKSL